MKFLKMDSNFCVALTLFDGFLVAGTKYITKTLFEQEKQDFPYLRNKNE